MHSFANVSKTWVRACAICDGRVNMERPRVSRLWRLLLLLPAAVSWAYEVSDVVEGKLVADESRQYTVDTRGILVAVLLTDEGDADLYASTVTKQHDHSDNQYSSYSCGLDLIVMPTSTPAQSQQVHVTVVGHGRHEVSRYKLVIISPSYDDINKYQVWDRDPESGRDVLLVDYDPFQIANDHALHQLLEQLSQNAAAESQGVWSTLHHLAEWTLYLGLETVKVLIEVLL